ncbi:MAG: N-methyl-D-aspartate receptor subunit [Polaromonas sp.]|nr:N-methyl-D-aspartate receptor subunit [Polaromonas sp.]
MTDPNAQNAPGMPLRQQSWRHAWLTLGATPPARLFDELVARYSEPQRRYHTLQHLDECLEKLVPARALAEHPDEVELALWFHDAIYELQRHDNELQSALWAQREMLAAGAAPEAAERVHGLIMATRHSALPEAPDERLLVDIDLAILGAGRVRFEDYERQVRAEYDWVPEGLFRARRREMLQGFLARPAIYGTEVFQARLEAQARENLRWSIAQLADQA